MKVPLKGMLILALVITNMVFVYYVLQSNTQRSAGSAEGYALLDPAVAEMEIKEYEQFQENRILSYAGLREDIQKIFQGTKGNYSFYYEGLMTGSWVGISEREGYIPASLIKIPVLTATLKKIEEKEISIDDYVEVLPGDIRLGYGSALIDEASNITVRTLITYICTKSDDTANAVLIRNLNQSEIFSALGGLGLPIWESADSTTYSPKQIANAFRSLYYASYLKRPYSNFALALLANNEQRSFIKSALPEGVILSHKVGERINSSDGYSHVHDCGIVYHPDNPYILCVMSRTRNNVFEDGGEAEEVFSRISKEVYGYVSLD